MRRWALQTPPPPGEVESNSYRPAPHLLFSGSNQTALRLNEDPPWQPPPLNCCTHPLIGISQLGHGHCLSSAVESLRPVNVELRSAQTADWAPTLSTILMPRFRSHCRHWFGFWWIRTSRWALLEAAWRDSDWRDAAISFLFVKQWKSISIKKKIAA